MNKQIREEIMQSLHIELDPVLSAPCSISNDHNQQDMMYNSAAEHDAAEDNAKFLRSHNL